MFKQIALFSFALAALVKADYNPASLPDKSDPSHGQFGFNNCVSRYGASNPNSLCQNVFVNSIKDWCIWGPSDKNAVIGDIEHKVVAYCMKSGYGTRLIPDGAITAAHFLKTPDFVQVTGHGDLTKFNFKRGDQGGELDPHGATGAGNPVGGLVFTRAFTGQYQQIFEWNNFVSYNEYCIRACIGPNAKKFCPHIYDLEGCYWNQPANYNPGFEQCDGESGRFPGIYTRKDGSFSTFHREGATKTPGPQPAGKSSNCRPYATISNGPAAYPPKKREEARSMQTVVARAPEWEDDE